MRTIRPAAAVIELSLIAPALLFMGALFLRAVQPILGTGHLIDWFSHHVVVGLDIFLIVMPLGAFIIGAALLLRSWRRDAALRRDALQILAIVRANVPCLLIVMSTTTAAGILLLVAMHMVTE